MTVGELIALLQQQNPEALAVREDYESEFLISEIRELRKVEVRLLRCKDTMHVQYFETKPPERRGWHSYLGAVDAVVLK